MKNLVLLILSMLFVQGCLEKDDMLPDTVVCTNDQLRMNGYYYQIAYDGVIYAPCCFYRNGILLTMGGSRATIEEIEEYIQKNYIHDSWYKKNKYVWQVFFIYDNAITIHALSSDYPHQLFVQEGIVLNDTTFKITKFSSGGKVKECNEIYHFREFSPKPDSTNVYIK